MTTQYQLTEHDFSLFKRRIRILLVPSLCLGLIAGCSSIQDTDYSEIDVQGEIVDVNAEETMILVEDQKHGQIWIDVSGLNDESERLHSPLEVNVWLKESVDEDTAAIGKAERVDVIK